MRCTAGPAAVSDEEVSQARKAGHRVVGIRSAACFCTFAPRYLQVLAPCSAVSSYLFHSFNGSSELLIDLSSEDGSLY